MRMKAGSVEIFPSTGPPPTVQADPASLLVRKMPPPMRKATRRVSAPRRPRDMGVCSFRRFRRSSKRLDSEVLQQILRNSAGSRSEPYVQGWFAERTLHTENDLKNRAFMVFSLALVCGCAADSGNSGGKRRSMENKEVAT